MLYNNKKLDENIFKNTKEIIKFDTNKMHFKFKLKTFQK